MEFYSTDRWDEELWLKIKEIYIQAFEHGRKPEKIIRKMFAKNMCTFHVGMKEEDVVSFALTGSIKNLRILLIDYLAVHPDLQNHGLGQKLFLYIKDWAQAKGIFDRILIEVECENASKNLARIAFWQKCGFTLVHDYTHQYIWVPEPYQAMWLDLKESTDTHFSGKDWFQVIGDFHKNSFR